MHAEYNYGSYNMLIQEKPSIERQELERMILQEAKKQRTLQHLQQKLLLYSV